MQYCLLAHDTRYQAPFFVAANSKSVPTASRVQRSAFLLSRPPPITSEPITPPPSEPITPPYNGPIPPPPRDSLSKRTPDVWSSRMPHSSRPDSSCTFKLGDPKGLLVRAHSTRTHASLIALCMMRVAGWLAVVGLGSEKGSAPREHRA